MKIVLWISNHANQKALANKIYARFGVSGIVIENHTGQRRKITLRKVYEKFMDMLFLPEIPGAWFGMLDHCDKQYKDFPPVETIVVTKINSDEVFNFTEKIKPDLVVVSGTRLIKKKLLDLQPSIGIINLHTGLSPYIKGGPNCTNWCIATNQFQFIGNTIMWIDRGIDTGNIISTELTSFDGSESLNEVHIKVMDHAHDLYVRAIEKLGKGERPNVPQDSIAKGITYYTKEWTLKVRFALKKNFKQFKNVVRSSEYKKMTKTVKTIKL